MTEETLSNDALIEEMLRDTKKVDFQTESDKDAVVHKGDEILPAPMVKRVTGAGYIYVWDTRTNEKIPVIYYRARQVLNRRRLDGSFRFTLKDPKLPPISGSTICLLHPKSEQREHYNKLGFRVCNKSNITNDFQLKQHMRKKHPQEWAAIESEQKEIERQEDRAFYKAVAKQTIPQKPTCDICGVEFGTQKTVEKHKLEKHKE